MLPGMARISYLPREVLIVPPHNSFQGGPGKVVLHANAGRPCVRCYELKQGLVIFPSALQAQVHNDLLLRRRKFLV